MSGQPPFVPNQFTGSIQQPQGIHQPPLYPNAPFVNQWTPYGWVPVMAPQPIPPPPGLFPYGYPWPQQMQPINMGLQYQDNGSSQYGNPSYKQQIALQQQPYQQNGSSENGNPVHLAQHQSQQAPQQHQSQSKQSPQPPQSHEQQSPQKPQQPQQHSALKDKPENTPGNKKQKSPQQRKPTETIKPHNPPTCNQPSPQQLGKSSDDKSIVNSIPSILVEESSPSGVKSSTVDNEYPQQETVHGSTHQQLKGGQEVNLDKESSTQVNQIRTNLITIPGTVVNTSNDASLVLVDKQTNMVMNQVSDSRQVLKTCNDNRSHDQNIKDRLVPDEKIHLKQVEIPLESCVLSTLEDLVLCERTVDRQHGTDGGAALDTQAGSDDTQAPGHRSSGVVSAGKGGQDTDQHKRALQIEPISDTWKEVPTSPNWKSQVLYSHQLRKNVTFCLNKLWIKPFLEYDKAVVFKLQFRYSY